MFPAFVDWVTIRQDFGGGGVPVLNGGKVIRIDSDGSVDWVVDRREGLDGSYDSRVEVRSDGLAVEFSGNIARYNRRDNLFGYTWPETVRRINALTNVYSLPPFTSGKLYRFADKGWTWSGARVSRIDVTVNFACGSQEGQQAVLLGLASQHWGRQKGSLSVDGATVEYGKGSRYVYGKVYVKATEFRKHLARKGGSHVSTEVIEFCERLGVLREEFTLKSRFLTQNGLAFLGAITQSDLVEVFYRRSQFRRLAEMDYETLNDLPRHLRGTYASWRNGWPLKLSLRTFYRHRRLLLAYGVDISIPAKVVPLPVRVRYVDVAALEAPNWYRQRYG